MTSPFPASANIAGSVLPIRRAEELIATLPGVLSVRIVPSETGEVDEVHVLTTDQVAPKHTVRNIESALMAQLGMRVNHRKISIATTLDAPRAVDQTPAGGVSSVSTVPGLQAVPGSLTSPAPGVAMPPVVPTAVTPTPAMPTPAMPTPVMPTPVMPTPVMPTPVMPAPGFYMPPSMPGVPVSGVPMMPMGTPAGVPWPPRPVMPPGYGVGGVPPMMAPVGSVPVWGAPMGWAQPSAFSVMEGGHGSVGAPADGGMSAGGTVAGVPMAGAPMAGAPMAGAPMAGAPMAGAPIAGVGGAGVAPNVASAPMAAVEVTAARRLLLFEDVEVRRSRVHGVSCRVTLSRDGQAFHGETEGQDTERSRIDLAARATLLAIAAATQRAPGAERGLALEGAKGLEAFDRQFVFVSVLGRAGRDSVVLTGSCEVRESAESSAVLAVLDATNRWIQFDR